MGEICGKHYFIIPSRIKRSSVCSKSCAGEKGRRSKKERKNAQ